MGNSTYILTDPQRRELFLDPLFRTWLRPWNLFKGLSPPTKFWRRPLIGAHEEAVVTKFLL